MKLIKNFSTWIPDTAVCVRGREREREAACQNSQAMWKRKKISSIFIKKPLISPDYNLQRSVNHSLRVFVFICISAYSVAASFFPLSKPLFISFGLFFLFFIKQNCCSLKRDHLSLFQSDGFSICNYKSDFFVRYRSDCRNIRDVSHNAIYRNTRGALL